VIACEPMVILTVEDDPIMRMISKKIIELIDSKTRYLEAFNGQHAFEILEKLKTLNEPFPTIILCDLDMPILNGFEFIRLFQKKFATEHTKIIVVTSTVSPADIKYCYSLGINCILEKPLSRSGLETTIAKSLRG
jgi:CheY-like chemotaxis protein